MAAAGTLRSGCGIPTGSTAKERPHAAAGLLPRWGDNPLPEYSMMAQTVLTGLVIMADRIAGNTAYFPLIAVEGLARNYNPNRGERTLRKPRLPESRKVSAD